MQPPPAAIPEFRVHIHMPFLNHWAYCWFYIITDLGQILPLWKWQNLYHDSPYGVFQVQPHNNYQVSCSLIALCTAKRLHWFQKKKDGDPGILYNFWGGPIMAESNQNAQCMMWQKDEKERRASTVGLFVCSKLFLWRAIWDSDLSESSSCCFTTNGSFVIGLACLSRNGVVAWLQKDHVRELF